MSKYSAWCPAGMLRLLAAFMHQNLAVSQVQVTQGASCYPFSQA